jgi:hypothetical protein
MAAISSIWTDMTNALTQMTKDNVKMDPVESRKRGLIGRKQRDEAKGREIQDTREILEECV